MVVIQLRHNGHLICHWGRETEEVWVDSRYIFGDGLRGMRERGGFKDDSYISGFSN